MSQKTEELAEIMQTLGTLQSRVQELTSEEKPDNSPEEVSIANVPQQKVSVPPSKPPQSGMRIPKNSPMPVGDLTPDQIALLGSGISELSGFSKHKSFPEFFNKLAEQTGLRLLLLKRWTSGLQVFMEKNIKMPSEAKKKRQDGRAPIHCKKPDIFEATGEEAAVYCGPVPVQHFPLDLTLMLGRGSRDRHIIILPLPSQNHWNTFLYLDADKSTEKAIFVAEVLAQFALARMCLLNKGVRPTQGRVPRILQAEQRRRREARSRASNSPRPNSIDPNTVMNDSPELKSGTQGKNSELDVDPFSVEPLQTTPEQPTPAKIPLVPKNSFQAEKSEPKPNSDLLAQEDEVEPEAQSVDPFVAPEEAMDDQPFDELEKPLPGKDEGLTPEMILNHSGELPALPKAACHIMAVIEDPRTTATRLEKALAMDQTLTAKVLRIANSPFYGAVREVRTVSEAIVRLGFVTIRNWTLVTAARSVFLAPGAGMMYKKVWTQSVLSAMAGQMVAQKIGRVDGEAVFIGGLMQNIGQLVLARSHPVLFQEIQVESENSGRPYDVVERHYLGFDHGILGSILIKEWNLSRDLEEAVRWHHDFNNPEAKNTLYAAMIALGEEIAWNILDHEEHKSSDSDGEGDGESDVETAEDNLSDAAKFLKISSAQFQSLMEEAEKLKIDPHFFN